MAKILDPLFFEKGRKRASVKSKGKGNSGSEWENLNSYYIVNNLLEGSEKSLLLFFSFFFFLIWLPTVTKRTIHESSCVRTPVE